jgi:hypothetical protein
VESVKERVRKIEEVYKALVQLILAKEDPFVREIVNWIKTDEEFFQEFINSLDKRKVLLSAIRRILIETSEKIYSN